MDIAEAASQYEQERPGLGERFVADLDETLAGLAMAPLLFPRVDDEVRRCGFRHFPYAIYYLPEEPCVVVAVLHRRRDPMVWKRRL